MRSIKEAMSSETFKYPYTVALATKKGIVNVTLYLQRKQDANAVDAWIEEMKDNGIYAADGGPNDIEI